jgi:putative methyltransferase (TIGR04325 family)
MKSWLKRIPYIWQAYENYQKSKYAQEFATVGYGSFWGIFDTLEQARSASPQTKSIGYNDASLAKKYQQMLEGNNWENSGRVIRSSDYPAMFWLKCMFDDGCTKIVDFGGNVGIHYYTYAGYLKYPANLEWTICEVPEISKVGKELCKIRGETKLFFTTDLDSFDGKDILIASGSIQYVEDIALTIDSYKHKPKHLLINRLPLYDGKQFVTLQNGGEVFYPQFVFNKDDFLASIERIGYELIDIWQYKDDSCYIPFDREHSVSAYSGLYARLTNPGGDRV